MYVPRIILVSDLAKAPASVHKMQNYARSKGLTEFISMQNYHNAIYREEEREMVPLLQDLGVGMIPWSPLARGFLTRPVSEQTLRGDTDACVFLTDHYTGKVG